MIDSFNLEYQPGLTWYLTLPQSEFTKYIVEVLNLINKYPDILLLIKNDLDQYAIEKKKLRLEDKVWKHSQNELLPGFETTLTSVEETAKITLETGRHRKMTPIITCVFIMIRAYLGGIKNCDTTVFIQESITVQLILQQFGITPPCRSTILENINAVSEATRLRILDCQLQDLIDIKMDDFKELLIDSTAVAANSCFPKDSELFYNLTRRIYLSGKKLPLFGINEIADWYFPKIIKNLQRLSAKINMESGKKDSAKKRRKWYREIYRNIDLSIKYFEMEIEKILAQIQNLNNLPSKTRQLMRIVECMQEDLSNLKKVRKYSSERLIEEQNVPGKDKLCSISDPSAAFIVKGQRDTVIGYKPQLVRSGMGFITEIVVPQGNASDSGQFVIAIENSIKRTAIIPDMVSADDGYPSAEARQTILEKGVKVVSFNGAKGKKITPVEDWESEEYQYARNQRSAVESLMFTIKNNFDFGRVMRRGIQNVRIELLEKVLAYNFCRTILMRQRQSTSLPKVA